MIEQSRIEQLRRLMELKEKAGRLEEEAKQAKQEFREAEAQLFEDFMEGPVDRLNNVDLGEPWGKVSFAARETYYGRVIPGMQDEVLQYFEDHHLTDEYTHPEIQKKRLNELVRERREAGEALPPGVDFYASRGVTTSQQ